MYWYFFTAKFVFSQSLSSDSCFQNGECIESFHLSSDFVSDEFDCLENCKSDPLCHWFNYFPQLSACELLHNCSSGKNTLNTHTIL